MLVKSTITLISHKAKIKHYQSP